MSDAIDELPPLREILASHGLSARKNLGQHFLLDLNLTKKIARLAGPLSEGTVIEVGPGPGGLTRALLQSDAPKVIAIEKDPRCVEALQTLVAASGDRLVIIADDALTIEIEALGESPRNIVANLPYNVGTPLLVNWLQNAHAIASMTLMFQKEVAARIAAQPGEAEYGRLSVLCNWRCETDYLFTVPARAFTPPPKVDSAIVQLRPYQSSPYPGTIEDLQAVTGAAFGQRRKTLRRSLSKLGCDVDRLLDQTGIDGALRAENLTVHDFGLLASVYAQLRPA